MNDLKPFQDNLAARIAGLLPTARRKMTQISQRLCEPDNSAGLKRRKRQSVSAEEGWVKREQFTTFRTSRFMKVTVGNDAVAVVVHRQGVKMVNVHQYGLKDKPGRSSVRAQYDARPLIRFNIKVLSAAE